MVDIERLQLVGSKPGGVQGIIAGGEDTAHKFSRQIDNDIMKKYLSSVIANNLIEGINRLFGSNEDAGLFGDFSLRGDLERFTQLNAATRNGPLPLGRWIFPLDQKDLLIMDHHRTYGHTGF